MLRIGCVGLLVLSTLLAGLPSTALGQTLTSEEQNIFVFRQNNVEVIKESEGYTYSIPVDLSSTHESDRDFIAAASQLNSAVKPLFQELKTSYFHSPNEQNIHTRAGRMIVFSYSNGYQHVIVHRHGTSVIEGMIVKSEELSKEISIEENKVEKTPIYLNSQIRG